MNSNADALHSKLEENSILRIAGTFDAMSAKLVELNKFDAVWEGKMVRDWYSWWSWESKKKIRLIKNRIINYEYCYI